LATDHLIKIILNVEIELCISSELSEQEKLIEQMVEVNFSKKKKKTYSELKQNTSETSTR
jgi:hypothetical protein